MIQPSLGPHDVAVLGTLRFGSPWQRRRAAGSWLWEDGCAAAQHRAWDGGSNCIKCGLLSRRKEVCTPLVNTEVMCLSVFVCFRDKMTFRGFTFGATQGSKHSTVSALPVIFRSETPHISIKNTFVATAVAEKTPLCPGSELKESPCLCDTGLIPAASNSARKRLQLSFTRDCPGPGCSCCGSSRADKWQRGLG